MAFVINNNAIAANTARSLDKSYGELSKTVRRLSSGLRVSNASDDAAGLAIRELLRSDISVLNQGIRNANDAISLIQTADSALAIIDEKLIRMKELSEQAATGTYNSTQRVIIDSEFQAMASEINRIANATDFNGIKLLDGSLSGEHNGSSLSSSGAMKIHFGTGNDSAEDYYYINIPDSTIQALFHDNLVVPPYPPVNPPENVIYTMEVLNVTAIEEIFLPKNITNIGDAEGQNIIGLSNGNALVAVNDHRRTTITLVELNPNGSEVRRINAPRVTGVSDVMQPKQIRQMEDGSILLAYSAWARGPSAGSGQQGLHYMRFDQNLNFLEDVLVSSTATNIAGPEDIGLSVAGNSILGTVIVGGQVSAGMTDLSLGNARQVALGAGNSATSATLAGKHFVVTSNAANMMEGYFVEENGAVNAVGELGFGSEQRLVSFGDKAVLVYSRRDDITGLISAYARVVKMDGSVGEELRINDADLFNNSGPDIDIIRNSDGTLSNQIVIAWTNGADNGTLMAEVFGVGTDALVTTGAPQMTFTSKIPGHGLGPANIAALNNGTIAADWQEDIGGVDNNAFGFYRLVGTMETIPVPGTPPSVVPPVDPPVPQENPQKFRIDTQELAQKMLGRIDLALERKENIRAHLGTMQNRLENTVSSLQIQSSNVRAAESRISDVNAAIEMTKLTRSQIITQSAIAMLSQANSLPSLIQKLLI